jgi:hypothetical protein
MHVCVRAGVSDAHQYTTRSPCVGEKNASLTFRDRGDRLAPESGAKRETAVYQNPAKRETLGGFGNTVV